MHLLLYIPIWFYSNGVSNSDSLTKANFTFQSGSIQIKRALSIRTANRLYIPIWLYSNDEPIHNPTAPTGFTFQSGSIQIISAKCDEECKYKLYIPIWLYSNCY